MCITIEEHGHTCQVCGKPNQIIPQYALYTIPVVGEPFECVIVIWLTQSCHLVNTILFSCEVFLNDIAV